MRSQSGFTLAELMVGLAVVGLTLAIGVPGFTEFVANQTQTTAANDMVTAMAVARSESIKQNRFVTICRSSDGLQCNNTGSDWKDGWIVFSNSSQANIDTVDGDETVIRYFNRKTDNGRTITPDVANLSFVAYRPSGTITTPVTWTFCDSRGDHTARGVSVDRAGRARAFHPTVPDPQPDPPVEICGS